MLFQVLKSEQHSGPHLPAVEQHDGPPEVGREPHGAARVLALLILERTAAGTEQLRARKSGKIRKLVSVKSQ